MIKPCIDFCYNRYGKQYSSDCDDKCEYAKVIREKKILEEKTEQCIDILNEYMKRKQFLQNLNTGCNEKLTKDCKMDCKMCPCESCDKRFYCDGGNPMFGCDG